MRRSDMGSAKVKAKPNPCLATRVVWRTIDMIACLRGTSFGLFRRLRSLRPLPFIDPNLLDFCFGTIL